MERRKFIFNVVGTGLALNPLIKSFSRAPFRQAITSGLRQPVMVYNNWSSYDELSDNIPLTEELAMRELNELIRLKNKGVNFDYYMMDAFWFDKKGGYRVWHKEHWPNGPDKWLNACKENGIKPGMWFSTNMIAGGPNVFLESIPEWADSVATDPGLMCLCIGGYLKHLSDTMQMWYDRGVRAFKFDFAYFSAATEALSKAQLPQTIEEMNKQAFMTMLKLFRGKNSDAIIVGYNGFGGDMENTVTPFRKTVDPRWLEVFDTLYSGDPRFSDVPMMNIWRAQDNYSDHMVRQFEFNGLPIRRIDNCAFMIGKTGTCYSRALQAWKGMAILEFGRGGWMNVIHGNLELFSDDDAVFFAKVQSLFMPLQRYGLWSFFGEVPGHGKPYGFKAEGINGSVITMLNPSQEILWIDIPVPDNSKAAVIYSDGGFKPVLQNNKVQLGAEQMVVMGVDEYANEKYSLGIDNTIKIPKQIAKIQWQFSGQSKNTMSGTVKASAGKDIRIIFQQFKNGVPYRSWGGAPPNGTKMSDLLKIAVTQGTKKVPLQIQYDKMIWSGLSWGVAEIRSSDFNSSKPIIIKCSSAEKDAMELKAEVFEVEY